MNKAECQGMLKVEMDAGVLKSILFKEKAGESKLRSRKQSEL